MELKTYDVYFEQINQDKITIKAFTKEEARMLAKEEWKRTNLYPDITIEERTTAER